MLKIVQLVAFESYLILRSKAWHLLYSTIQRFKASLVKLLLAVNNNCRQSCHNYHNNDYNIVFILKTSKRVLISHFYLVSNNGSLFSLSNNNRPSKFYYFQSCWSLKCRGSCLKNCLVLQCSFTDHIYSSVHDIWSSCIILSDTFR